MFFLWKDNGHQSTAYDCRNSHHRFQVLATDIVHDLFPVTSTTTFRQTIPNKSYLMDHYVIANDQVPFLMSLKIKFLFLEENIPDVNNIQQTV